MKINLANDAVILCGAGASVAEPANLATVAQFLSELEAQCLQVAKLDAALVRQALHGNTTNASPRFEEIIACLLEFDPDLNCLQYLRIDTNSSEHAPNALHYFMAKHIRDGGIVVTTNFDALIEVAYQKLYNSDVDQAVGAIWKVHGSIQTVRDGLLIDNDVRTLKADIFSVAAGTPISGEGGSLSSLSALLEGRHILAFGYSFSDTFDVVPALVHSYPREATIIEFSPSPLKDVNELSGLAGFEIIGRSWRQRGTILRLIKGDPYALVANDRPPSSFRAYKPLLPDYSDEHLTYLVARLLLGQDAFAKANPLFAGLASEAADTNIRIRATMQHVRTLPDWDEIVAYESTLLELESATEIRLSAVIILLNGYSFIGPGAAFLKTFLKFKQLARTGDVPEKTRALNFGKAYHCFANYLMNRGRPNAALRFAGASLVNRTRFGEPRDIYFSAYACCLALALAEDVDALRKRLIDLRKYARALADQSAQVCLAIAEGLYLTLLGQWHKALTRLTRARNLYVTEGQNDQIDPELELYILEVRLRIEGWSPQSLEELIFATGYIEKHRYSYFVPIIVQLNLAASGQPLSGVFDRLTQSHLARAGFL